jgi:hypothetical protein
VESLPTTGDLLRVMTILGIPGDPLYIMKDHTDEHRRAALMARIAAALVDLLEVTETDAGLCVDDRADLHWQADCDAAGAGRTTELQTARLAWAQHSVGRARGVRSDPVADTVATTLGVLIQLLTRRGDHITLPDALVGLRAAADHLGTVLRATPRQFV